MAGRAQCGVLCRMASSPGEPVKLGSGDPPVWACFVILGLLPNGEAIVTPLEAFLLDPFALLLLPIPPTPAMMTGATSSEGGGGGGRSQKSAEHCDSLDLADCDGWDVQSSLVPIQGAENPEEAWLVNLGVSPKIISLILSCRRSHTERCSFLIRVFHCSSR